MSRPKPGTYLLVDIAHNVTKSILIENQEITGISKTQTTVDEPLLDVTIGVLQAIKQLENERNVTLISNDELLPEVKMVCDSDISGGLHMLITGVISNISGESAQRAALGAGALLIDTFSKDDDRPEYKKIEAMRTLKPDILLMSGGIDGGATSQVIEMAEIVKKSDIKPRFGQDFKLPLIYAGNISIQKDVDQILGENGYALQMVENVRPLIDKENLGPARESIYDAYMEHVIIHSPGYKKLAKWCSERIVPAQAMSGKMFYEYAQVRGVNLIAVDIGGDTTDVYSVYNDFFNRSLNAGIGLTYGINNIMKEAGIDRILRWLPSSFDERTVRNIIGNIMINPREKYSLEEKQIQSAVAREAINLGLESHKSIASRLKGVVTKRTIADMFDQALELTLIKMLETQVIIGKGEAFRYQSLEESMQIIVDSLQPAGVTELYLDSENMAAPFGNLLNHHKKTALNLFTEHCLRFIGACIAPSGQFKNTQEALKMEIISAKTEKITHIFNSGELIVIPIKEKGLEFSLSPIKSDLGSGRGRPIKLVIYPGELGIIIDTRGRPMKRYRTQVRIQPFEQLGE